MCTIERQTFSTIPSTHQYCETNLKELVEEFFIGKKVDLFSVVAAEQTMGKGRKKEDLGTGAWISPPGGLYLSCLIPIRGLEQKHFIAALLTLMEHIALKVTEKTQVPIQLAWPNDLTGPGGKIAGMMASQHYSQSMGSFMAIISLGFNVSVSPKPDLFDALAHHDPCIAENSQYYMHFIQDTLEQYLIKYLVQPSDRWHSFCPREFWQRNHLHFDAAYSWYQLSAGTQPPQPTRYLYSEGVLRDVDSIGRIICTLSCGKTVQLSAEQVHRLRPL